MHLLEYLLYHKSTYKCHFSVYLLVQELFVDKIHVFKFLSVREKPRLLQLKIISLLVVQYKLLWLSKSFHPYGEITSRKGKYPLLRTNIKPHQLINHARISYSIVSIVFRKFWCSIYRNRLNRGTSKLRQSNYLKKYEPC